MARKYFFKFKTFQNHTCRVDIYDSTYSGTAIELSKDVAGSPGCPSDSPLVIEEDNSDDLLENARIKTGYISLIELINGGLNDLFPLTDKSLEMFVFIDAADSLTPTDAGADDKLIFQGFIQAQSFDMNMYRYRDELKIPFQSQMGVIGEQPIGTSNTMLRKIFATDFANYKYIVFPEKQYSVHPEISEDPIDIIEVTFMKNILFPYNQDYNHGVEQEGGQTPSVYTPMTKMEFIEAICDSMGLVAHDVGNMLVFAGAAGRPHRKYLVSQLGSDNYTYDVINPSTVNINTYFSYASDKSKLSYVLPADKLISEWKKPEVPTKIDLSMCRYSDNSQNFLVLEYVGNQIESDIWNNSSNATANGIRLIGYRGASEEVLEVRSNQQGRALFELNFEVPYLHYQPSYINNLHIDLRSGFPRTGSFEIAVYSNGKYYNFGYDPEQGEDEWVDNAVYQEILPSGDTIDQRLSVNGKTCTIYFRNGSSTTLLHEIKGIYLDYVDDYKWFLGSPYTALRNRGVDNLNTGTLIEKTVNLDLHYYCDGFFLIEDAGPYYKTQRNLTLYLRKKSAISELMLLLGRFALSNSDNNNHVVSTAYDVREDIYELQVMSY